MDGLLAAFFAQIGIVTYREYQGGGIQTPAQAPISLPIPAAYTAPILVYGVLGLVPGRGSRIATMIGWGFVVATLLNLWNPSGGVNKTGTAAGVSLGPLGTVTGSPTSPLSTSAKPTASSPGYNPPAARRNTYGG